MHYDIQIRSTLFPNILTLTPKNSKTKPFNHNKKKTIKFSFHASKLIKQQNPKQKQKQKGKFKVFKPLT